MFPKYVSETSRKRLQPITLFPSLANVTFYKKTQPTGITAGGLKAV